MPLGLGRCSMCLLIFGLYPQGRAETHKEEQIIAHHVMRAHRSPKTISGERMSEQVEEVLSQVSLLAPMRVYFAVLCVAPARRRTKRGKNEAKRQRAWLDQAKEL
jgi:hypothetical protein